MKFRLFSKRSGGGSWEDRASHAVEGLMEGQVITPHCAEILDYASLLEGEILGVGFANWTTSLYLL